MIITYIHRNRYQVLIINNHNYLKYISDYISGVKYDVGKTLQPGDYVEVTGIYAKGTESFSINLGSDDGSYLLHAAFRPTYATIYNSRIGEWGTEVRPGYFPGFQDGKEFKITIVCMDDNYKLYFNDEAISKSFPYRKPIADVSYVYLSGGSGDFSWTGINMPTDKKHRKYQFLVQLLPRSILS